MRYMMLIFEDEAVMKRGIEEHGYEAYLAPWHSYTEDLKKAGVMAGGDPLEPANTATTVSVRDKKSIVQDGPFIDTKEQLGGYYIFEVESLDEAIRWAERCPASAHGHLELRPIASLG